MSQSTDSRKLIYAVVKFLKSQLAEGSLSEESTEAVEVCIQCLEAAYNVASDDPSLDMPMSLEEVYSKAITEYRETQREPTDDEKAAAETLKNEGNLHINAQNFGEAIACYTKAIQLDPKNAVYYCNRAAASNKLGKYESAIQDCKTALKYDASYGKAYGRLGLAYANLNQHEQAVNSYKKALELEPGNDSYRSNLKLAEDAMSSSGAAAAHPFQNVDLAMIFSNPNLLSMASQMLANPSMQNMMSNILSGNMNQEGGGIEVLLQASQQLAQQMESENPLLVEQLRQHMGGGDAGDSPLDQPKPESQP